MVLAGLCCAALLVSLPGCLLGSTRSASGGFTVSSTWREAARSASSSNGLVTICAAGDVNFGDGVTPTLTAGGLGYPFSAVADAFGSSDLSFVNLECAISSKGSPVPGKQYTFEGPSDSAEALKLGKVQVVSLANNHSKDYGPAALVDTFAHLQQSGIRYCGAGNNTSEAYSPAVLDVRGKKVAFLAFDDIVPDGWPATGSSPGCATCYDEGRVASTIKNARAEADYVIASFHWGIELATSPDGGQKGLAHLAVDSGADLVLGHHPHVVQGFELYKGKLIAYSLGNFVFAPPRAESARSVMLVALLGPTGVVEAKIVPAEISGCRPSILSGQAAASWVGTIAAYSKSLGTPVTVVNGRGYISGGPGNPR